MGAGAAVAAGTRQADDAAHAALLRDPAIQFRLEPFVLPQPPAWLRPLARVLKAIAPYLTYIFWGVLGVGVLLILFLVVRELTGIAWRWPWRRRAVEEQAAPDWQPDVAAARTLLAEADAMADRGDFGGAVRLLLRRSVEDVAERLPDFLRPSLTARDIANAERLPERARGAFAVIASVEEAALFARVAVGEGGWRRARDAYETFALGGSWAAPRQRMAA